MSPRNYGRVLACAGVLCLLLAFALLTAFKGKFGKDTVGISSVPSQLEETMIVTPPHTTQRTEPRRIKATERASTETEMWVVYVTGAVRRPGVYEISPLSRVYEALNAAGGFSADADQEAVNLAAKLQDGAHIIFPRKGAALEQSVTVSSTKPASQSSVTHDMPSTGKVNINTADQKELESIRGIGPKTAQAIIDYRKQKGNFERIEDIMNVRGIGAKKFEAMKEKITVGN